MPADEPPTPVGPTAARPVEPPVDERAAGAEERTAGSDRARLPVIKPGVDRGPVAGGLLLAGLGAFLLFAQLVPDAGTWIPLFIGLIFLGAFAVRREYGLLVAGSIISGAGLGVVLQDARPGELSGAVMLLSVAAGFVAIWSISALLRLPENHWWPLIPGGIVALLGAMQLAEANAFGVMRWWPLALIIVGILLIGRAMSRSRRGA